MLYDKMVKTNETRDVDAFLSMIDEDFVMVSHQNQTERSKQEFAEMVRGMMSSDSLEVTDQRCVYENDDILDENSYAYFLLLIGTEGRSPAAITSLLTPC